MLLLSGRSALWLHANVVRKSLFLSWKNVEWQVLDKKVGRPKLENAEQ